MDREVIHPRAAKYRAARLQDLLSHIDLARRSLEAIGIEHPELLDLRIKCVQELNRCAAIANERTEPRARKRQATWEGTERKEYFLFLDECGSHVPSAAETAFPVFALCGVIIERKAYESVNHQWKEWKQAFLGSDALIHEPNARLRTSKFRGSSFENSMEIQQTLDNTLSQLDFDCVASVVDLRRFKEEYPDSFVDEFLPRSCYLMSIDFVLERFMHFLQNVGEDARGSVIAESRGAKEDATVHAEFIRLHLEGTQFIADTMFRYHLRPYMEFLRKRHNNTGLQIADLAARPFAEKALNPRSTPIRWDVFSPKLYDGLQGAPHKYGLKVFPLSEQNDPFPELPRKARGALGAPLAD